MAFRTSSSVEFQPLRYIRHTATTVAHVHNPHITPTLPAGRGHGPVDRGRVTRTTRHCGKNGRHADRILVPTHGCVVGGRYDPLLSAVSAANRVFCPRR